MPPLFSHFSISVSLSNIFRRNGAEICRAQVLPCFIKIHHVLISPPWVFQTSVVPSSCHHGYSSQETWLLPSPFLCTISASSLFRGCLTSQLARLTRSSVRSSQRKIRLTIAYVAASALYTLGQLRTFSPSSASHFLHSQLMLLSDVKVNPRNTPALPWCPCKLFDNVRALTTLPQQQSAAGEP